MFWVSRLELGLGGLEFRVPGSELRLRDSRRGSGGMSCSSFGL